MKAPFSRFSCLRCAALQAAIGTTLLALLPAAGAQDAAPAQVLRASPFGPSGHLLNRQVLAGWAEAVQRATAGRVRVDVLPQPVASPAGIKAAVQRGDADVSIVSNGALPDAPALHALVEFAAQSPDAERASVAYQRIVARYPAMSDEFEPLVLLAVFTHGPGAVLLKQAPAPGPLQLAQLSLHAGASGAAGAVRAMGAQPVMGAGPAARELMDQGRAAGTVTPLDSYLGFGLAPQVKSVLVMPGGFYNAGFALLANRERWQALPAADRAAIAGVSGEELARAAGRAWDEGDARARAALQSTGIALQQADAVLAAQLLAARPQQERAWIDRRGVLAADAENALAEYREELRLLADSPR